ncbi:MAG: hypothetical protein ACR2HF_12480 [Methylococcaceae bacterium]
MAKKSDINEELEVTTPMETMEEANTTHVECTAEEETSEKPSARKFLAKLASGAQKGVYTGVYAVSYGVVYAGLLVGGLIPTNSIVSEGMRDGSSAARKAYDTRAEQKATSADDSLNAAAAA